MMGFVYGILGAAIMFGSIYATGEEKTQMLSVGIGLLILAKLERMDNRK